MKVLVTGGAGYIGSHVVVLLLQAGYDVAILDNLSNSHPGVLKRIASIAGRKPIFINADIRDSGVLCQIMREHSFVAVMHFAGLKSVSESTEKPLEYFDVNVSGTTTLLRAMNVAGVKVIVFSSSATVYGASDVMPIAEECVRAASNPYGRTKLMAEDMLTDLVGSDPDWRVACLRYFNPVGAHESGLIGESPLGSPNNLVPYIAQVAIGRRARLNVFGADYPTPDGTGVRDYIHVMDLAEGHLAALDYLQRQIGMLVCNLGTGQGHSVLEMLYSFEKAIGQKIPYTIAPRRPGDVATCWADPARAEALLGWRARRDVDEMCIDTWRWQQNNPEGYK